jgi:hypothetical protein
MVYVQLPLLLPLFFGILNAISGNLSPCWG